MKKYLDKYSALFDEMMDLEDLDYDIIKSHEYFLEYIDTDDYIGYDFSKYPVHKLMDNGCGDFFSGLSISYILTSDNFLPQESSTSTKPRLALLVVVSWDWTSVPSTSSTWMIRHTVPDQRVTSKSTSLP